ncbi:hypothetical protein TGMAS_414510 [Toxoplasma gondii MAS]|uniref:Uncharacterized protein n=1 Tax=Toxoplasma gondii MAS TaxID=943118 RepID=A0A086QN74_TOXGO|nr:hypothetical protein TGMAS_414510 [Toxoplasma gondii MAS]
MPDLNKKINERNSGNRTDEEEPQSLPTPPGGSELRSEEELRCRGQGQVKREAQGLPSEKKNDGAEGAHENARKEKAASIRELEKRTHAGLTEHQTCPENRIRHHFLVSIKSPKSNQRKLQKHQTKEIQPHEAKADCLNQQGSHSPRNTKN